MDSSPGMPAWTVTLAAFVETSRRVRDDECKCVRPGLSRDEGRRGARRIRERDRRAASLRPDEGAIRDRGSGRQPIRIERGQTIQGHDRAERHVLTRSRVGDRKLVRDDRHICREFGGPGGRRGGGDWISRIHRGRRAERSEPKHERARGLKSIQEKDSSFSVRAGVRVRDEKLKPVWPEPGLAVLAPDDDELPGHR
jgi:hypothetical protein